MEKKNATAATRRHGMTLRARAANNNTISKKRAAGDEEEEKKPMKKSQEKQPQQRKRQRKAEPKPKKEKEEKEEQEPEERISNSGNGPVTIGDHVPDFEVVNDEGVKVSFQDMVKDNGVVIFFYPRANTPGCTKQACGFRDDYEKYQQANYKVFGMSGDRPKPQSNWRAKHSLPFPLLCDPEHKVLGSAVFGVSKDGGKSVVRSHVVIERGGRVKDIRRKISPGDSVQEALRCITGSSS
ncbi:thioredoxin peroxidase dot5 [Balamuthia mandrillaris]